VNELPGDIQIDLAIHRLGFGSPCLPKQINAKIERLKAEREPEPPKRKKR
jgi:hypothetical protein